VNEGSAADVAGLKSEDVIIGVGERDIKTTSQLQEMIARYRPGDDVLVKYKREGELKETILTLKNMANSIAVVEKEPLPSFEIEGAKFQDIDETIMRRMEIRGGAQLVELGNGAWSKSRVKENFIITKIGEESVRNIAELQKILETKDKDFYVMGKYPNGEKEYYRIDW